VPTERVRERYANYIIEMEYGVYFRNGKLVAYRKALMG
jgi:hypothetical protein